MANALFENLLSERYIPNRQDSHIENLRPEAAFLDFFKQSLVHASPYCTDTTCCSFLNSTDLGTESERDAADCESQKSSHLKYPLLLFEDLWDLPPVSDLQTLAHNFDARILPGLCFLQKVSSLAAEHVDIPFHLLLCKALLGVEANDSQSHRPVQPLWRASVSLITGAVEVDNSLGRRLAWLTSAVLLVAFGSMEADANIWNRTADLNGYVQATLFRSDCFIENGGNANASLHRGSHTLEADASALKSFYLLVDTLRSIHFHTPSTVDPSWSLQFGCEPGFDLRNVCEDLVLDRKALPNELSAEDHLLVVISLLADTNALLCSLGQLIRTSFEVRSRASILYHDDRMSTSLLPSLSATPGSHHGIYSPPEFQSNPHVPLTADNEFYRLRSALSQALDLWGSSFQSRASAKESTQHKSESSIIVLSHFAKLLLAVGPTVYALPALSGYLNQETEIVGRRWSQPIEPHMTGIKIDDKAVQIAADLLEAIDYERSLPDSTTFADDGTTEQPPICPMWYPLALFYGALVVWARHEEDKARRTANHILLPSKRLLQMFHTTLVTLQGDWGCATKMSRVVEVLIR